jgi:hypothetical protein
MRKLFIAATVLAMTMLSVSSFAATNDSNSNKKNQKDFPSEEMIKELNLTDQQVSDLKAGEANLSEQMKKMSEEEKDANKEEKKGQGEKTDKMKEARLVLMKKVLNNDQYIKFLENEYVKVSPPTKTQRSSSQNNNLDGGPGGFGDGGFGGGQGGPQD